MGDMSGRSWPNDDSFCDSLFTSDPKLLDIVGIIS